ncbi:MAG: nucleoside 2-deoxyribosyltransferase [Candidatus Blackburnbacteria bacterium]|nr:nucleoside 2-deoxyribosyltransferase [Candidatus Blackburnbacteria bacterium]
MVSVYLSSRYKDYRYLQKIREVLNKEGIDVTSQWIYGGQEATAKCGDQEKCRYANQDLTDLYAADVLVIWSLPKNFGKGTGGRHVELGIALALDKPIILVGKRENIFHWLKQITVTPSDKNLAGVIRSVYPAPRR